ncbi:MAG: hypothetical protein K2H43_07015, partial [Clostridia bacterium]|nr:hypothetical protein [Clostridia bacterium]
MCNSCNSCNSCSCNSCNSCNSCGCNSVRRALNNLFSTSSWNNCGCGCGWNRSGWNCGCNSCNSCGCSSCGFEADLSAFTECGNYDSYYAHQYAL